MFISGCLSLYAYFPQGWGISSLPDVAVTWNNLRFYVLEANISANCSLGRSVSLICSGKFRNVDDL